MKNRELITASSMLGEKIVNTKGEKLGIIKDITIDLSTGQVSYVVLSFGGFLGTIEKLFAIPFENFKTSSSGRGYVLDLSEEALETTEEFDKDDWPMHPQPEFMNLNRPSHSFDAGQSRQKQI